MYSKATVVPYLRISRTLLFHAAVPNYTASCAVRSKFLYAFVKYSHIFCIAMEICGFNLSSSPIISEKTNRKFLFSQNFNAIHVPCNRFITRYLIQQVRQSAINFFCCILAFGWFPGIWILWADVSEHCSVFIGGAFVTMEQIECFETSAYKIQTPGNRPKERIQHSEHGESLKSKTIICHLCSSYTFRPLQGHHGGIFKGLQVQELMSNLCVSFTLHTHTVEGICCIYTPLYIPPWWWPFKGRNM
jgi:hypothetical protein